jgi:hypothetical protein
MNKFSKPRQIRVHERRHHEKPTNTKNALSSFLKSNENAYGRENNLTV